MVFRISLVVLAKSGEELKEGAIIPVQKGMVYLSPPTTPKFVLI
jgi:hypothetical protein